METVIYQCRPPEQPQWYTVPTAFVENFRAAGYEVVEYVRRDEAVHAIDEARKQARKA